MSYLESPAPAALECAAQGIEIVIEERPAALELDGFTVGRLLPLRRRRMVGPFIFFDHMGPAELVPGGGMDVRPHPHIGLATVTYLFEGEILHRDSLGFTQPIRPGEINWMTAGRGIAHSERTPPGVRATGSRLHGLQLWVALPDEQEEIEPSFDHYAADVIPEIDVDRTRVRLLAGTGWGARSPVRTYSPQVYAEMKLDAGRVLPLPREHPELAVFVLRGALTCGAEEFAPGRLIVLEDGALPELRARSESHVLLLGGSPVGKRHIWWNFVSSSKERIEQAKRDWKEGRFGKIPGDEVEFVPLPER
jgi:redox-sensitive bicupin YhaK (pirin superfamily)